jgi:hypothetical protein
MARETTDTVGVDGQLRKVEVSYYGQHGSRISVIEQLRGKSGWLMLVRLTVTAFDTTDALLFSALTDGGDPLRYWEDCEENIQN